MIQQEDMVAWNSDAIRDIASEFGRVMEVDEVDFDSQMLNSTGALIHTMNMEEINTVLTVSVNKRNYNIRIVEDDNRSMLLNSNRGSENNSGEDDTFEDSVYDSSESGVSETEYNIPVEENHVSGNPWNGNENVSSPQTTVLFSI